MLEKIRLEWFVSLFFVGVILMMLAPGLQNRILGIVGLTLSAISILCIIVTILVCMLRSRGRRVTFHDYPDRSDDAGGWK